MWFGAFSSTQGGHFVYVCVCVCGCVCVCVFVAVCAAVPAAVFACSAAVCLLLVCVD